MRCEELDAAMPDLFAPVRPSSPTDLTDFDDSRAGCRSVRQPALIACVAELMWSQMWCEIVPLDVATGV
jgi:hypothetical protein